ncbi:hypothetical protein TGAM01_v200937 [Trichoderma gamsii]|uniref:Uncharacterized protein n=1 Tax=Trichoderma gamsii TaxID=398673 RepID=A0A2P5A1U5_9HYPO|nr:hypothetical protein TGAM01_v200937 [Trichoderma gamsii]PON30497.1 hypothetical protein TGAM01_v200937 [Trichoderma gamsii]
MSRRRHREASPSIYSSNTLSLALRSPIDTPGYIPQRAGQRLQRQGEANTQRDQPDQSLYPPRPAHNGQGQSLVIRTHDAQSMARDRDVMSQTIASPMAQLYSLSRDPSPLASSHIASPMQVLSPPRRTAPAQILSDVTQFHQTWTDMFQRRDDRLINSFDWDGTVLTIRGQPLVNRQQRMIPPNNNVSSMGTQESSDIQLVAESWIDDTSEFSQQTSTISGQLTESDQHNTHDYLDNGLYPPQDGDGNYIASQAPSPQERPQEHQAPFGQAEGSYLDVRLGLEQMVANLDALYQRPNMGRDISGYGRGMLGAAEGNPQTPQDYDANADIMQGHFPVLHDKSSFICPYAMRYPDLVHHNCFQKINTIPYLKQHLRNVHHDAMNCPHQCQKKRAEALHRRSRSYNALHYDSGTCLQIKQRSDRSKSHIQQWDRIYQILFPHTSRISDPCIKDWTIKQLRTIYKFKEKHGPECLAPVYHQLHFQIRQAFPEPEDLYRMAFCTWLPKVFEQRFPTRGQELLGDFLKQINSAQRRNSHILDTTPIFLNGDTSASVLRRVQIGQQDTSRPSIPPHIETGSDRTSYSAIFTPFAIQQQQGPIQPRADDTFFEPQHNYSQHSVPHYLSNLQSQTDIGYLESTPDIQGPEYDSYDSKNFLFDQCAPLPGSPSQFFADVAMDMEDIGISETDNRVLTYRFGASSSSDLL